MSKTDSILSKVYKYFKQFLMIKVHLWDFFGLTDFLDIQLEPVRLVKGESSLQGVNEVLWQLTIFKPLQIKQINLARPTT